MPTAFDQAFQKVKQLVADFRANEKFYLSPAYQEQEARRDFQKEAIRCKVRLRINGRCHFKTETLASHGCHSVERQQGHRIEIGRNPSRSWNQRLAQASPAAGEARFYFPQTPPRRVCGRLLLARLPVALSKQVLRSGTSVGANYREASRGRSKAEFISKIGDCLKEIEETEYWLELLVDSGCVSADKMADLLDETRQLIAIFTTIDKNSKS